MADDSTDDKRKNLLFLHGMESRYGKKTPKQVEAVRHWRLRWAHAGT